MESHVATTLHKHVALHKHYTLLYCGVRLLSRVQLLCNCHLLLCWKCSRLLLPAIAYHKDGYTLVVLK